MTISKGVKGNSVSERGEIKYFWCCSLIGVVLGVSVGVVYLP